ncbi:hypothetical protein [Mycoplasma phocimorsus]|uniref:hypothetical protein n=1 Tax=Mycoplasma phocimorsus TaxID=3045839 RepID=UPI0024BF8440|nr:hypothetical protein [Mycoplasma phocimorsus]MDJ1649145.1 hypothetical protein [Mycoplasma phocimorsus]
MSWLKANIPNIFSQSDLIKLFSSSTTDEIISSLENFNFKDALYNYKNSKDPNGFFSLLFKIFKSDLYLTNSFLDFIFSLKNNKSKLNNNSYLDFLLSDMYENPTYKGRGRGLLGTILSFLPNPEKIALEKRIREQDPKVFIGLFKKYTKESIEESKFINFLEIS